MSRLLALALALGPALALGVGARWAVADVLSPRRAVAIVYDDSGSMDDDQGRADGKWRYANYALQALVGLLDPADTLTIVRMSDWLKPVPLDLGNQARTIRGIRDTANANGSTPYDAVLTAMDALVKSDADQRWLVVISDGAFGGGNTPVPDVAAFRPLARDFIARTGSHVAFLLIDQDADELEQMKRQDLVTLWQDEAQAEVVPALSREEIIRGLQEIAAAITSRSLGTGPSASVVGNDVTIDSEFPLRRLTLLAQAPDRAALAPVASTRHASAGALVLTPLDIGMPPASANTIEGRLTQVQHPGHSRGQVIPEGEITIHLDRPMAADVLKVLLEVAARLDVALLAADGSTLPVVNGTTQVCPDDPLLVTAGLVADDGTPLIGHLHHPEAIQVRLLAGASEQAMALDSARQAFTASLKLHDGHLAASVSAAYPGYFDLKSNVVSIQVRSCPRRRLGLMPAEPWASYIHQVSSAAPYLARPAADGQLAPPAEFGAWTLRVVDAAGLDLALEKQDAATAWALRPRAATWPFAWLLAPTGRFDVRLAVHSGNRMEQEALVTVPFIVRDLPWSRKWGIPLMMLAALAVLAWYIVGLLRKPRFPAGSAVYVRTYRPEDLASQKALNRESARNLPGHWWSRWLAPYRPERRNVDGVTFRATRRKSGAIILPKEAQSTGMELGPERLEPPLKDRLLQDGDVLTVPGTGAGRRSADYRYTRGRGGHGDR